MQRLAVPPESVLSSRFGPLHFDEYDLREVERVIAIFGAHHQDAAEEQVIALRAYWQQAATDLAAPAVARCVAIAHDLAGLGRTFGLPLVTDLCRSLNRFLRLQPERLGLAREVVEIHLSALQIVTVSRIAGDGGEIGRKIAAELSRAIGRFEGTQAAID